MSIAVLYRWKVDPAKTDQFEDAWSEGTKQIHKRCGSYGARLHKGENFLYWSYALWPDEETRKSCFEDTGITEHESFARMQDAVVESYDDMVLEPVSDLLDILD